MVPAWREFELLVARMERALAPVGATVVSPDRVLDQISGNLREVDAAIRYTVAGNPVLVTVECRDRQSVEDNTWIEQLVTKQRSIGAARTIAVSSRGFSEPALLKAAHFGIDARTTRDVDPDGVLRLLKLTVHETCYETRLHGLRIGLRQATLDQEPPALAPHVLAALTTRPSQAPVFQRPSQAPLSWNDFWRVLQSRDFATIYADVPDDGSAKRLQLRIELSDEVTIDTVAGPQRVAALDSELELFLRHRWTKMAVDRATDYASPTTLLAQAVSYSAASLFNVKVTAVTEASTGGTGLSLELAPSRTD
jgi:hypothetical protein